MDWNSRNVSITVEGYVAGKIFVGGLHRDTTLAAFREHFALYGEITDIVIIKNRLTGQGRGFGFVTFADPAVVAKVLEDTHTFEGQQADVKRSIPRGMVVAQAQSKEFKTRKIFVGGIPSAVTEDEFKVFFSKYGTVVKHQIILDHETNRPRGFGFITFDNKEVVDQMLSMGNMIEMGYAKVEIKKATPKKLSIPPSASTFNRNPRGLSYNANSVNPYRGLNRSYGPGLYQSQGATGRRFDAYRYRGGNRGGFLKYRGYGEGSLGGHGGDSSFKYYSNDGSSTIYYRGDFIASSLGGHSRGGEEGYLAIGRSGNNAGYRPGPAASRVGVRFGNGSSSGTNRYHPFPR